MQATMYTTNHFGEYRSKPVSYGTALSGITVAEPANVPANTDFQGFGVAITGSSCWNLFRMDPAERRRLLRQLYTEDGLNLQIGRLSVGASDYSAEVYSYDDGEEDISLTRFSVERDKEYIIPMIKEILQVNPNLTLFASPWSPPGWMKTGGSLGGGYMREKYLDCYCDYFVKFIKAYAAEGIPIRAVTLQNEPETQQEGKMPACIWHPETEARFALLLRKKFDENGLDTKIWFYDHNFSGAKRVDWCLREFPGLQTACEGIAFHYYRGSIENTRFLKESYPDLKLHFTEGGPRLTDHYDTDWCKWGLMIVKALSCGYSSFTGWNLMLDESGGPNVGPFPCGGLVTRNSVDGSLSCSGQYKALRHFATIASGWQLFPLTMQYAAAVQMKNYPQIRQFFTEGCGAVTPEGKTVLYLVNPSEEKDQVQYFCCGKWWYIELMPHTVATVVIEP